MSPLQKKIGLVAVAGALALAVCIVLLRFRSDHRPSNSAANTGGRMISLVFLLRTPRMLDETLLQAAADRAFRVKHEIGSKPGAENFVQATEKPGVFVVQTGKLTLGLISVPQPYIEDVAGAADRERTFLLKKALQDHKAWLAVDFVRDSAGISRIQQYHEIGKLLAELAGDDCLALYCPETRQMNSYDTDLLPLLRGENPLAALVVNRGDPIVSADDDDPRMLAAVKEARLRWPEFVAAFNKRRPMQGFAVKVPFRDGKLREFMWVEVSRIDAEIIHGKLANEPGIVKNIAIGNVVKVPLTDLNDWIYSDGGKMVGGFTSAVLQQIKSKQ